MGDSAYNVIEKYCDQLHGSIVEIGSTRGEGSTEYFSHFVGVNKQFKFYSIDFEEGAFGRAFKLPNVIAYCLKGEDFLNTVFPRSEKICFAYLDNFDWIWKHTDYDDCILEQKAIYRQYKLSMNNRNSQLSHLRQSVLVDKLAADKCVILFDDTFSDMVGEDQYFSGKGGMAVPWLINNGWNLDVEHNKSYNLSMLLKNW